MNKTLKRLMQGAGLVAIFAALLVSAFGTGTAQQVLGEVSNIYVRQYQQGTSPLFTFFSATTTSATSTDRVGLGSFRIASAKKVTFYFSHGGATSISTGSSTFRVQVTPNESDWYDYNKLYVNSATTTERASVGSVSIEGATSTVIASMDLTNDAFYAVRCISTENGVAADAGEHTCKAQAEY